MPSGLTVAVLGCGPVGLATAIALTRAGHSCCLYDRFDRPAPVGSGLMLQPTGLAVLDALGVSDAIRRLGRRVDRIVGRIAPAGKAVLDVSYEGIAPGAHAYGIHRSALFDALMAAALDLGIPLHPSVRISAVKVEGGKAVPLAAEGLGLPPCDLVVDAMGARSPLGGGAIADPLRYGALWASLPWHGSPFREDRLEQRYKGAHTMVGVLPCGTPRQGAVPQAAFFWSLRVDRLAEWRSRPLADWKSEVLSTWPETQPHLDAIADRDALTFASYSHRTARHRPDSLVAHVGDAFHSTSPQLGQGANMGLLDAMALADAIAHASTVPAAILSYAASRRRHVAVYQALSRALTPFYQSDSRTLPLLRDHVVPPLARSRPGRWLLASTVAGTLFR